jgi:hypothetical protein
VVGEWWVSSFFVCLRKAKILLFICCFFVLFKEKQRFPYSFFVVLKKSKDPPDIAAKREQ